MGYNYLKSGKILGLAFALLIGTQGPRFVLGLRNAHVDRIRNEPLIESQEELECYAESVKAELGLDDVRVDFSSEDLRNESRDGYCKQIGKDHYQIVIDPTARKLGVLEHELFHARDFQTGKLKLNPEGKLLQWDFWRSEWRAQNYCLRDYKDGKEIK